MTAVLPDASGPRPGGETRDASRSAAGGSPGIIRVFPDLDEDLLLELFHKGAKAQWTSRDLEWTLPAQMNDRQRRALARVLTPIYLGEQTAMVGASGLVPQLMRAGETTAQLYITSFMMDEARHFEALTRVYRTLGHDPMRLREMPEMLRYHHRLRQGDRVDWVWGIFISDLFGKLFYRALVASQPNTSFGRLSARIIQDESRHQAFAVHYLRRNLPHLDPARKRALVGLRDELYGFVDYGTGRLRDDFDALGFDSEALLSQFWSELGHFSRHLGLDSAGPGSGKGDGDAGTMAAGGAAGAASGIAQPGTIAPPLESRATAPGGEAGRALLRCFGCLFALLCQPRRAQHLGVATA